MNVSNVIFKKLADEGIDTCFMVTGSGAMFLNDTLYQNNKIKKNFCHHEQTWAMTPILKIKFLNKRLKQKELKFNYQINKF